MNVGRFFGILLIIGFVSIPAFGMGFGNLALGFAFGGFIIAIGCVALLAQITSFLKNRFGINILELDTKSNEFK